MPRKPGSSLFGKMQSAQEDVMADVCTILRVSYLTGTYGNQNVITTGSFQAPCGFYFTNGQITSRGQILLVDYDVILRVPLTTPVYSTDQVLLVEKGTTMVSGTFYPTELPEIGSSAQTIHLKRTT